MGPLRQQRPLRPPRGAHKGHEQGGPGAGARLESSRGAGQEQTRFLVLQVQPLSSRHENVVAVFFLTSTTSSLRGGRRPNRRKSSQRHRPCSLRWTGQKPTRMPLHRGDCRCTPVPCIGQNHGLGVQPTLQTMQDDSPSSQQGLFLGWGGCLRSTRDGGASSVPGQAPAVPGGWDRLTRSGERFACGHGLRADGDKACCPGDWPNHGVHGSLAEASRAYLSRPEGLRPQGAFKRTDQSLQPLWRCRGVNHRTVD